jgi:hypothetical protein
LGKDAGDQGHDQHLRKGRGIHYRAIYRQKDLNHK